MVLLRDIVKGFGNFDALDQLGVDRRNHGADNGVEDGFETVNVDTDLRIDDLGGTLVT